LRGITAEEGVRNINKIISNISKEVSINKYKQMNLII
jgi:hypothetical protein